MGTNGQEGGGKRPGVFRERGRQLKGPEKSMGPVLGEPKKKRKSREDPQKLEPDGQERPTANTPVTPK